MDKRDSWEDKECCPTPLADWGASKEGLDRSTARTADKEQWKGDRRHSGRLTSSVAGTDWKEDTGHSCRLTVSTAGSQCSQEGM